MWRGMLTFTCFPWNRLRFLTCRNWRHVVWMILVRGETWHSPTSEDSDSVFLWDLTIYRNTRSHIPKSNCLHIQRRENLNLKSLLSESVIEEIQALCRLPFINAYLRTRKWSDWIHPACNFTSENVSIWGKKLTKIAVAEEVLCFVYTRTFECQTKWELTESKWFWRWCKTLKTTGILGRTF
jgi:hypothetical protein